MSRQARRTIWTGGSILAAFLAFVAAFLLLEAIPSGGQAAVSGKVEPQRPAVAPVAATAPADSRFVVKRILPISGPIRFGEWHWDESGVPAGPVVITVDLQANVLSIFRDGYEIGATAVLLGDDDKPTPVGTFPISQKDADHVSNLYDAPMPYMLRLTDDGVTIHATKVENGYVTHGCVGVPEDFARKLYAATKLGDKVIITDGARMGLGDKII
ncbi:L,D-transpeptidase family protein [Novosphingobium tardum]|uniref:L,D-transpeptidase family protein n=1 Tax=Novosphingobium tardum TaxID=1538021 RepID=A0ABV8RQV7_9SPHN